MDQTKNATTGKPKVLLIGWDGADWEHITPMLDRGELPTLEKLINGGVMGNLSTLQPVLSPMLWNSVATCKHADKHGIWGFTERDPDNGGARPYSSLSRKTKALWNILSQSGYRSNIINWWASHPAEKINGCIVSNLFAGVKFDPENGWQISDGVIHPRRLQEGFAKFKVFPEELTEAHITPFIPDAAKIDQNQDKRLTGFAKTLAETATTHAIATAIMMTEPWDFMAIYYTGIDHFCHGFMQYHPPKMPNTSDADFDMYRGVIEGAYRFHDMMLETLLNQIDDETTIILCSDHGFHSRESRPLGVPREPAGPAIWHRKYGILVMKGPGIKQDERIYGASLIDVGPTILSLFDLPLGEDMDGRPLQEAFENPRPIQMIPSWDEVDSDLDGVHRESTPMSQAESRELLQQFVALGYINDIGEDQEKHAKSAETESQYNLARCLMWRGKHDDALKILTHLVHESPWENRFIVQTAECYMNCGYLQQARRIIEAAFDLETTQVSQLLLLYAKVMLKLGEAELANHWLCEAERRMPRAAEVFVEIADVFANQRQWEDAERNYKKALEMNSENALALQGLSTIFLRLGKNQEAADTALEAVGLLHRLPRSHFNLGVAMLRSQNVEQALLAFQTTVRFAPKMLNAHRWLVRIYDQLRNPALADKHRMEIQLLIASQWEMKQHLQARQSQEFDLPEFESEASRITKIIRERPSPNDPVKKSGKSFVVVSGLPRSGTSLMMQMLTAAGIEAITDGERVADIDNPKGYFEWEAIKTIAEHPEILDDDALSGRVFKAVSVLLKLLPKQHDYKVVFMVRPIAEVAQSQEAMIKRLGTQGAEMDQTQILRGLKNHLAEILKWLPSVPHVDSLIVEYPQLIEHPEQTIASIQQFLGSAITQPERMLEVVDKDLYRKRS